jgi:inosine triphosphate pyrophosphatase
MSNTNTEPRKWFLEELGSENLYKILVGFEDKSATITCTFAFSEGAGHEPVLFQEQNHVN